MTDHERLLTDLRRFQVVAADAAQSVGEPGSAVRARLADEAATWQACLDLLSDPGVYLIAIERRRQVAVEGWTAEHDDAHRCGEMALAGAAYATIASARQDASLTIGELALKLWPWSWCWWKPKDPVRDLERSGALMAAEIGRLLRKAVAS